MSKFFAVPVGHEFMEKLAEVFTTEEEAQRFCKERMMEIYKEYQDGRSYLSLDEAIERHYRDPGSIDWVVMTEEEVRQDYPEILESI